MEVCTEHELQAGIVRIIHLASLSSRLAENRPNQ
jgi:hypothetical protein